MAAQRFPISALPLPAVGDRLIQNLRPDPETPSVSAFQQNVLQEKPSIQRRSRMVPPSAHYSFTSPLPLPFPFRIPRPEDTQDQAVLMQHMEKWLRDRESLDPVVPANSSSSSPSLSPESGNTGIRLLSSSGRNDSVSQRHLLALSQSCLEDCLPNLDVGDAFDLLSGKASLSSEATTAAKSRQELIDVLSGHSVLMAEAGENGPGYAPWALRYCGHQFGTWAGQLGDGRAVSLLEVAHPNERDVSYEIQLKGAGRTPYSRHADGLAVLRSSIREFLGAEAVHALGIPTSRTLSLISLPDIPVHRERIESASITSRVSPSFIRVGSFEAHDKPESQVIYFLNPEASSSSADWESMRLLGEWVVRRVLRLPRKEGDPWALELVKEAARRNATMVAGWQAYGFMHGVMNTDNISCAGLTLDYGPYSFMDIYEESHICNHTDEEGRYAFKYQPTMILYAMRKLLRSLAPLVGAEQESGKAVSEGWAKDADETQIDLWREDGLRHQQEVDSIVMDVFTEEYYRLMRKRLGLRKVAKDDKTLVQGLLTLLEMHELDFHSIFRTLSFFRPGMLDSDGATGTSGPELEFINRLNENLAEDKKSLSLSAWKEWLRSFAKRIKEDEGEWTSESGAGDQWLEDRQVTMLHANPRFVLRQWILEEVIAKCEEGDLEKSRAILSKMLQMSTHPFDAWGAEGKEACDLNLEEMEERMYCSLGAKSMLGFQCSCSS
ncbi:UPF0061-domain-containing protein [Clavulina sp. PMI_390]|nr:UPF0061-domain-containing protein [Clavulina sp. PMI_390]